MLLRAEDHGSPDFPPVCFPCEKQTGDHPTHPLLDYNAVDVYPNGVLPFLYEMMQMNAPRYRKSIFGGLRFLKR
jgi:hypothetical protein